MIVAVLRGGASAEHAVSLKAGAHILTHLAREPYQVIDVFIDRAGVWHVRGVPMTPERALSTADVAFNTLLGGIGDESVVKTLNRIGIPYTGSAPYASSLAQSKPFTKKILERAGVLMPRHTLLSVSADLENEASEAFRKYSPPIIVKPSASGSSVGLTLAKKFKEFWDGVKKAFSFGTSVMVEEFIPGREASAGIVEGLRESPYYQMIPTEIGVPTWDVYDYDAKFSGSANIQAPGNFSREESLELERLAKVVHEELGLRHYSQSDFVVSPHGIYFLEANPLPSLSPDGAFQKSLDSVGVSTDELIDHLIGLAAKKR